MSGVTQWCIFLKFPLDDIMGFNKKPMNTTARMRRIPSEENVLFGIFMSSCCDNGNFAHCPCGTLSPKHTLFTGISGQDC